MSTQPWVRRWQREPRGNSWGSSAGDVIIRHSALADALEEEDSEGRHPEFTGVISPSYMGLRVTARNTYVLSTTI